MASLLYSSLYEILFVYGTISKDFSPFKTLGGTTGLYIMCALGAMLGLASVSYGSITSKKQLKHLYIRQDITKELEHKYQMEISKVKDKVVALQDDESLQVNKVISLEEKTNFAREELEEELQENYSKNNVKPKRRILKRNDL